MNMMNMTCPEDFQLSLNNQAALHNIQALQSGNFLLQGYSGPTPFSGQLILPAGFPSNHAHATPTSPIINTNGLAAAVTSSSQQLPPALSSYPSAAAAAAAAAAAVAGSAVDKNSGVGGGGGGGGANGTGGSSAAAAAAAAAAVSLAASAAQAKKFRGGLKSGSKSNKYIPKPIPHQLGNLKTYSNPDILICGNCRELFNDLVDMLDHKKNYCKMRFTCRCESGNAQHESEIQCQNSISYNSGREEGSGDGVGQGKRVFLKCTHCKEVFSGAWDLMFHVQNAHSLNIYSLGENKKANKTGGGDR